MESGAIPNAKPPAMRPPDRRLLGSYGPCSPSPTAPQAVEVFLADAAEFLGSVSGYLEGWQAQPLESSGEACKGCGRSSLTLWRPDGAHGVRIEVCAGDSVMAVPSPQGVYLAYYALDHKQPWSTDESRAPRWHVSARELAGVIREDLLRRPAPQPEAPPARPDEDEDEQEFFCEEDYHEPVHW